MIQFIDVKLQHDSLITILDRINFFIDSGEYIYLTGNNGAGKTSILSLIHMQNLPTAGQIRLFGRDVSKLSNNQKAHLRRKIGILFQEAKFIEHISIFDNIAIPLRIIKTPEKKVTHNVNELLKWLGLSCKANMLPSLLSGGERQLVSLARAVIARPSLILADEPTAHIDISAMKKIILLLEELNSLGTTIVMSTHDQWILDNFPKKTIHLQNGLILDNDSNSQNKLQKLYN